MGTSSWRLRAYREEDRRVVRGLLGPAPDPLHAQAAHPLHGPSRDGARWRRTLVAERGGEVVGAVTLARNWVHRTTYTQVLDVAAAHRRAGLGRALLDAARELAEEERAFAANVRAANEPALAMLISLRARLVQTAPCPQPDPAAPAVTAWVDAQPVPPGVTVAGIEAVPGAERPGLYARMYAMTHERWSPTDPVGLAERAAAVAPEADPGCSVVAVRAGAVVALAWLLGDTVVAETVARDEPDGAAVVAAAVAGCLRRCAVAGLPVVTLDGHPGDPHLGPLLAAFPAEVPRDRLLSFVFWEPGRPG